MDILRKIAYYMDPSSGNLVGGGESKQRAIVLLDESFVEIERLRARVAELEEELTAERRRLEWWFAGVELGVPNCRDVVLLPLETDGNQFGALDWRKDPGEWLAGSFREAIDAAIGEEG